MTLKVKKTQLEATVDTLSLEQETAAAVSKTEVLKATAICSEQSSSSLPIDQLFATLLDPMECLKRYVSEQAKEQNILQLTPIHQPLDAYLQNQQQLAPFKVHASTDHFAAAPGQIVTAEQPQHSSDTQLQSANMQDHHWRYTVSTRNQSPPCPPRPALHLINHERTRQTWVIPYFAHCEMVTTGLSQFNDQPQIYKAWKRRFRNVVRGLDLTSSKEMDLDVSGWETIQLSMLNGSRLYTWTSQIGILPWYEKAGYMLWSSRSRSGCTFPTHTTASQK